MQAAPPMSDRNCSGGRSKRKRPRRRGRPGRNHRGGAAPQWAGCTPPAGGRQRPGDRGFAEQVAEQVPAGRRRGARERPPLPGRQEQSRIDRERDLPVGQLLDQRRSRAFPRRNPVEPARESGGGPPLAGGEPLHPKVCRIGELGDILRHKPERIAVVRVVCGAPQQTLTARNAPQPGAAFRAAFCQPAAIECFPRPVRHEDEFPACRAGIRQEAAEPLARGPPRLVSFSTPKEFRKCRAAYACRTLP